MAVPHLWCRIYSDTKGERARLYLEDLSLLADALEGLQTQPQLLQACKGGKIVLKVFNTTHFLLIATPSSGVTQGFLKMCLRIASSFRNNPLTGLSIL